VIIRPERPTPACSSTRSSTATGTATPPRSLREATQQHNSKINCWHSEGGGLTEERFWLLLVSSRRDQMPQLTTAVGVIRIIAPPPFPLSSIASASPLTWTQRGCHGGSTSSMTMQTF